MSADPDATPWGFDISSLMVLVSEGEEEKYRLSQRSLLQCLVMAPVVGLQNYIRSYEFLLDAAKLTYFSPDGVKSAPLRYMRLSNALASTKALEDGRYTVYSIPDGLQNPPAACADPGTRKYEVLILLWVLFTWLVFGGVLAFTLLAPKTTWVGTASVAAFTGWSLVVRLIERANVQLAHVDDANITRPGDPDAVYVLGRTNAAVVLEGTRRDVKRWTTRGLVYRPSTLGIPAPVWKGFTRLGSLLMLLFIFSTVPNGSTLDQVAFIVINGLAQVNVVVGQSLNSRLCLAELELVESEKPATRTYVYGLLVRRFKDWEAKKGWVEKSGMLPQTDVWKKWKDEVLLDDGRDVKAIYDQLASR